MLIFVLYGGERIGEENGTKWIWELRLIRVQVDLYARVKGDVMIGLL
jgi:hypothetical protein